jgi:hypothetical protein
LTDEVAESGQAIDDQPKPSIWTRRSCTLLRIVVKVDIPHFETIAAAVDANDISSNASANVASERNVVSANRRAQKKLPAVARNRRTRG